MFTSATALRFLISRLTMLSECEGAELRKQSTKVLATSKQDNLSVINSSQCLIFEAINNVVEIF